VFERNVLRASHMTSLEQAPRCSLRAPRSTLSGSTKSPYTSCAFNIRARANVFANGLDGAIDNHDIGGAVIYRRDDPLMLESRQLWF